jgi:predicted dehydrogenase
MRVAVIGVGRFGRHHARIYGELDGVELVGVVDLDGERAAEAAGPVGAEALTDYRKLEGRVDAVSVAVPTEAHREVAGFFLERGVHCLVEKPLVPSSALGHELIALAEASGAQLGVGHVERFNPVVRAARKHDIQPRFIESHRIHPFAFRSVDVGVVLDIMIHDLDLILSLAGAVPERVEATGVAVLTKHEDIANARLTFPDGCVANVTASRVSMKTLRRLRLFSRDSYLSMDFGEKQGILYKKSPKLTVEYVESQGQNLTDLTDLEGLVFGDMLTVEPLVLGDEEPLTAELQDFVNAAREGRAPAVSGADGLRAVELAERILEAIDESPAMRVPDSELS